VVEQSPYFFPEFGKNRLEDAIKNNVRFADIGERLVKPESPMLFIGAVNALTGDFRVFKSHRADKDGDQEFIFNVPLCSWALQLRGSFYIAYEETQLPKGCSSEGG